MRILSLTAGAASMYCGSCLRDNALAAELIRQGHDVTLLPFYTPTLTDEENVSRQAAGVLRRHQRLSRAAHAVVPRPSAARSPGRCAAGDQGVHQRIDRRRSEAARRLDGVDAARTERPPAQGDRQADRVREGRSAAGRRQHSVHAADQPGRAAEARAGLAGRGDAAGRGSLSRGIARAVSNRSARSRAQPGRRRRSVHRRQRVLRALHARLPAHSRSEDARRPARREHQRSVGDDHAGVERIRFTIGFFARIAPEKGLHNLAEAYRILRTEKGLPPSRLLAAGYLAPEHKPYLEAASPNHFGRPDSATSSCIAAPSIARTRCVSSTTSTCCRCRADITSRRVCIFSKRWRAACRSCSRITAPFRKSSRAPAAECCAKSEAGADVADAIHGLWKDPAKAAALGRAGAEGVRRHYTVQHMADGVLKAYEEAGLQTRLQAHA